MELTSWGKAPDGGTLKADAFKVELVAPSRVVNVHLNLADERVKRETPMTMEDWVKRRIFFPGFVDRDILQDSGKVTAVPAKTHAEDGFEKYHIVQEHFFESGF